MRVFGVLPIAVALLFLAGCDKPVDPADAKGEPPVPASTAAAPEDTSTVAREVVAKTKDELADLEGKLSAAKAEFEKAPEDNAIKAKFVDLSLQLAYDAMMSEELSAREKYPKALALYREVLKVEPENKEASDWKTQIEDIYRSMGRPVPTS
jgi:tetratricopeptide (TPR) repeat protein